MIVVVLTAAVAVVAMAGAGHPGAAGAAVEVTGAAGWHRSIPLDRDGETIVPGPLGDTLIEVRRGRARILSSPCPRQVCRRSGWVDPAGGVVVCVPNGVAVRVPPSAPGAVDALTR